MIDLIPAPEPLGLPVPVWILLTFKVFGFFLHLLFMNLWLAALPTALCLLKSKPRVADRLFHAVPFFMAFGINAGIVPLLFLQTLYPQFFYPATILQAWFWFFVIPLLLLAYYGVYLASFNKFRVAAALIATALLYVIALMFSSALTLTANPQAWPEIFLKSNQGGAVHGVYFHFEREVVYRFLLVVGMTFGTLAAYLAADAEWFAADPSYRRDVRTLVLIYLVGAAAYGLGSAPYLPSVQAKLPLFWLSAAGGSVLAGALAALSYWKKPTRAKAVVLIAAQIAVLAGNAIARQWVQVSEIQRWYDPYQTPVRGEWGSFALFIVSLTVALALLFWIGRTALCRTKNKPTESEE